MTAFAVAPNTIPPETEVDSAIAVRSQTSIERPAPDHESLPANLPGGQPMSDESQPTVAAWLAPLEISAEIERQPVPQVRASNRGCLEMSLTSYLELLEWSGRQWRADKRGVIPQNLPPVFERLSIPAEGWLELLRGFRARFRRVAGSPSATAREAARRRQRYLHGMPASRSAYGSASAVDPAG